MSTIVTLKPKLPGFVAVTLNQKYFVDVPFINPSGVVLVQVTNVVVFENATLLADVPFVP